jgi:hypothetical protein
VIYRCPQGVRVLISPTDATGRFEVGSLGTLNLSCMLEVHKPGYATKVIDLRTACARPHSESLCSATVELTRLPATTEGAR